jgi:hypothetical protein
MARPEELWRLTLDDVADVLGLSQRRADALGRQIVGATEEEARDRATQAGCRVCVTSRDGKPLVIALKYDSRCIYVTIEDDVVIAASPGEPGSIPDI